MFREAVWEIVTSMSSSKHPLRRQNRQGHHHGSDVLPAAKEVGSSWTEKEELVHDWNGLTRSGKIPKLVDETLRDGLQSPSARDPTVGEKIELLHYMVGLGIDCAAIGMPCAHNRQREDALRLAREIATEKLPINAYCVARTRIDDIKLIIDISEEAGFPVGVATFIASSPIRQYVENWPLDMLERSTDEAVTFATRHGLPVLYVSEDTTRSKPEVLTRLYRTAIRAGAERLCISDTVGHATPKGTRKLVRFVRNLISEVGAEVEIDWHGHRDRGLDVANSLAAFAAGADRCHGTILGIGERSGNTPIEQLLVNLRIAGAIDQDLTSLTAYAQAAARALRIPIPANHPIIGTDAFRTSSGIHAAAIIKAAERDEELSDQIYSSVPAPMVGRQQRIEVGPMSGESNVRYYLLQHGLPPDDDVIRIILDAAKRSGNLLEDAEIATLIGLRMRSA
jgi:2-isopropylmalate synthase